MSMKHYFQVSTGILSPRTGNWNFMIADVFDTRSEAVRCFNQLSRNPEPVILEEVRVISIKQADEKAA